MEDKKNKNKDECISYRLSMHERKQLKQIAKEAGISVSKLISRRCLSQPIKSNVENEMIRLICKLVGLQKHFYNENDQVFRDKTRVIIDESVLLIGEIDEGKFNSIDNKIYQRVDSTERDLKNRFRCTYDEKEGVREAAEKFGFNMSDWIRDKALGKTFRTTFDLKIIDELNEVLKLQKDFFYCVDDEPGKAYEVLENLHGMIRNVREMEA